VVALAGGLETWFLVQDAEDEIGRFSYINHKGEYRMKNELRQAIFDTYVSSQWMYPFYEAKNNVLGYVLADNVIYDLYEMKTVYQVPGNLKALSMDYATDSPKTDPDPAKRKNAIIYLWVLNGDHQYYIDTAGKHYQPAD